MECGQRSCGLLREGRDGGICIEGRSEGREGRGGKEGMYGGKGEKER